MQIAPVPLHERCLALADDFAVRFGGPAVLSLGGGHSGLQWSGDLGEIAVVCPDGQFGLDNLFRQLGGFVDAVRCAHGVSFPGLWGWVVEERQLGTADRNYYIYWDEIHR